VLSNGLKRQQPAQDIVGSLLQAEIAEKQARSIRYQVAVAKLPLIKELAEFDFSDTPINEGLVRDMTMYCGRRLGALFSQQQREDNRERKSSLAGHDRAGSQRDH
jgi:hypothetical protein